MRTLPVGVLLVLTLAVPSQSQSPGGPGGMTVPDVTITDASTVDQPVKRIKCKATVVGVGGAVVQSVKFEIYLGANQVVGAGGQGTKQPGTNDWKLVSIVLPPNTDTVKTIVTYTVPGNPNNQTKSGVSGNLVIMP